MTFSSEYPNHQNAVDLVPGWVSAMPRGSGLVAGSAEHFTDVRPIWAAEVMGGLSGKTILEVGPLEAYNTFQFESLGAASVVSIEASEKNFLRCLIVKNILSLQSTFFYGDAVKYMETSTNRFDVLWLSGVLYHMTDPARLLRACARMSNAIFIWTQYFDADIISSNADNSAYFVPSLNRTERFGSRTLTLHYRSYNQIKGGAFSGGADEYSYWMSKEDIMGVLSDLGYSDIVMGIDNPNHPPGPACFFVARRPCAV